jgi:hypothetical protein
MSLDEMIQSWKRFSATQALKLLRSERRSPNRREDLAPDITPNRSSAFRDRVRNKLNQSSALQSFWQREYWDTFMRDEKQERTAIRYIENNPVRAKLCRTVEKWPFSSTKFRDNFQRLLIPTRAPISESA